MTGPPDRQSEPLWAAGEGAAEAARAALGAAYDIVAIGTAEALLDRIAAGGAPAAVVLGARLAGRPAAEVCAALRRAKEALVLPVVVLAGRRDEIPALLDAGASDALPRPWDADELSARVAAHLRLARRAGAIEAERARAEEAGRAASAVDHARRAELATQERRAEEESRLEDEFLANVSHELRTPLTAMLGWARMLNDGSLPEATRPRALMAIERNAWAQKRVIEDLLDVSRLIAGKLRIEAAPVELPPLVEAAVAAARPAAERKRLRLEADLGDVGVAVGDAARIRQIVANLLDNAVKFTPAGGAVRVSLAREGPAVRIAVADTGEGIPAGFLPHVFERFRQADGTTTRRHGGLGVGLTIARHLAGLHGGSMEAHSEGEGRGATFVVRLPLLAPRDEAPVSRVAPAAALPELGGVRALIVDDEDDMRGLVVAALQLCGADAAAVATTGEAMARFAEGPPDVLISDIGMPGEDGYALLRAVRALPPDRGGRVPAVALTAYARDSDRAASLRAGFDEHVVKPLEPAELLAVVARVLGRA